MFAFGGMVMYLKEHTTCDQEIMGYNIRTYVPTKPCNLVLF